MSPIPGAARFVVKNGSKTRERSATGMPMPVSVTVSTTCAPAASAGRRAASPSLYSAWATPISSSPPAGMASVALRTRSASIRRTCTASARTRNSPAGQASVSVQPRAGERAERAPLAADEGREVQDPGADRLAGREPEQAGRELAAPARGLLDVGDVRRGVRGLAGEPGVAEQDGQQVVDLVGDAAREPAEAVHLLRVPQLLLEPAHVGDVGREAGEAHDLPRLVADGLAAVVHVDDRAVRAHHAVLDLVAVEPAGPGRVDARAVAGMHALQPARRVGEQRVDRPAPQQLVRRAAIEHPLAVRADHPQHRTHVVREVADGIVQALP